MKFLQIDDDFVRRLCAGDPVAGQQFFDHYGRMLQTMFRRLIRMKAEAEDLSQIVLMKAFISLCREDKGPKDKAKVGAWIAGIARNTRFEWFRVKNGEQLDERVHDRSVENDIELRLITFEKIKQVRHLIATMEPRRDADLLKAVYLDERDRDEVCREFGVDREYLRVRVHRALKRFKELYPWDE